MVKTVEAVFDGKTLYVDPPLNLIPNTRVKITIELPDEPDNESVSFLDTALSIDLKGPADWSEKLDDYLYWRTSDEQK